MRSAEVRGGIVGANPGVIGASGDVAGAGRGAPQGVPIPFLIRRENIVRYENGSVFILDRRAYPFERTFVRCDTYEEVARAIEQMVTQSYGPAPTAGYGLALAADAARDRPPGEQARALQEAARRLIATRPTNNHIRLVVDEMLEVGRRAAAQGADPSEAIRAAMDELWDSMERDAVAVGRAGASLIEDGDRVLTHCWADAPFVHLLREALLAGRRFEVICTETRPYLQGARLTADAVGELGVPTTLVTDSMPAHLMARGMVTRFFAGADRVTMDGHWINKIGTFPIALAARRFDIPAYAVCYGPDPAAPDPGHVRIEERDPEEVLHCRGVRTATARAVGFYPAFDVTPPDLVTGVVTDRGVFGPQALADYFRTPRASCDPPGRADRQARAPRTG